MSKSQRRCATWFSAYTTNCKLKEYQTVTTTVIIKMPDVLQGEYISSHIASLISIQLRASTPRTHSQIPENYRSSLILLLNSPPSNILLPHHQGWVPDHPLGPDCLSPPDCYVWPVHMDTTPWPVHMDTIVWPVHMDTTPTTTSSPLCVLCIAIDRGRRVLTGSYWKIEMDDSQ